MLKKLSINGFKCFSNLTSIEFAPITIIIGPNNSGKSTILQSLLLIKQTVESKNESPVLQLNGPHFDFGTYKDLVSDHNLNRNIIMEVEIESNNKNKDCYTWKAEFGARKKGKIIFVRRFKYYRNDELLINGQVDRYGKLSKIDIHWIDNMPFKPKKKKITLLKRKEFDKYFSFSNFALFPRHPFAILQMFGINASPNNEKAVVKCLDTILDEYFSGDIIRMFNRASYIGPLRNHPLRVYTYTGQEPYLVGSRGENTYAMLVKNIENKSKESKKFWTRLNKWFVDANLAEGIKLKSLMQRFYEVKIKGVKASNYESIMDVGFGNSQVMPLVVDYISRQRGVVHIVEQPEIHLHPKAQCEIGKLLLDALHEGKQSIIETHSLDLIFRLRRYIAEGNIKRHEIKIYYVNQKNGVGKVTELELGENFSFSNWPKGFFEERYYETMEISKHRGKTHE
jgi:predicted ATPase